MPSSIHNNEESKPGTTSSYVEVPVSSQSGRAKAQRKSTANTAHLPGDERQSHSFPRDDEELSSAVAKRKTAGATVDARPTARQPAKPAGGSDIDDLTVIHNRERSGNRVTGASSPVLEMASFLEGTQLDQYEIGNLIGGGGMGAVFKARDNQLGRDVAVKVLNQTTQEMIRRFDQEAKAAAQLTHQNIAVVYGAGFDQGWHYIAFELLEGKNIRDIVVENGRFKPEQAIRVTMQVVDALEHADQRGLVHRDIKPSNIVITPNGLVKVVDLGLARVSQSDATGEALTASGVAMGTFDYCSPEQAEDPRRTDLRSDIYSLGCTLYFMLTGRAPFAHEPPGLAKMLAHRSKRVPDPRHFVPDMPLPLASLIMRMLAKNPSHRHRNAQDLREDMQKVLAYVGRANQQPTRNRLLQHVPWVAGFILLAATGVAAHQYTQQVETANSEFAPVTFAPIITETPADIEPAPPSAPAPGAPETPSGPADKPPVSIPELPASVPPTGGSTGQFTETSPLEDAATRIAGTDEAAGVSVGEIKPAALTGGTEPDGASVTAASDPGPAVISAGAPAGPSETEVVNELIRVAVVGPEGTAHAEDEAVYTSLAEACQAAASQPSIELVELRFNGVLTSRPLALYGGSLTLQAAAGYSPVVQFNVDPEDAPDSGAMIVVSGGQLNASGIHFQVQLPARPFDVQWAIFELDEAVGVSLDQCSLTIVNMAPGGVAAQYNVSFFTVNSPETAADDTDTGTEDTSTANADVEAMPVPGGMPSDMQPRPATPAPAPVVATTPPLVELRNCVARGQATLVDIPSATQLRLQWTGGLFLSTRHLLTIASTSNKPRLRDLVQLTLDHVTVFTQESLCLVQQSAEAPFQAGLKIVTNDCIYVTRNNAPLIEHVGVEDMEMTKRLISYSGANNFYPATRIVWRVTSDRGLQQQYDFDDALSESWFDDQLPQQAVVWQTTLPLDDKQVHLLGPDSFQLKQQSSNPAYGSGKNIAGFAPGTLSVAPEASPADSEE